MDASFGSLQLCRRKFDRLGAVDVGPNTIAGNTGEPLEIKNTSRRNLLPRIEGLMANAQPFGELA
ncbi:hypothetical protein MAUB1S_09678 [Mycolicibacterium aubagnense]